jgi:hypothetical protein
LLHEAKLPRMKTLDAFEFDRSSPSFLLSITIKPLKCLERHADIGLKRSHVI